MENKESKREELLSLATEIVASYVSNNELNHDELPSIISNVYQTLNDLSGVKAHAAPQLDPAVPIKKSVRPDYIICLEDGIKLKMLKRHLKSRYNMTPEEYREKWGLPADYPMVAPNYAMQRRELAKQIGLGRSRGKK